MYRAIPSVLLTIFLTFFATTAQAWYVDFSFDSSGGEIYTDSTPEGFGTTGSGYVSADAGWEVMAAGDDPSSDGVIVEYNTWDWGDSFFDDGSVTFQILSDFGNTTPQPVDVFITADISVMDTYSIEGHDTGQYADGDGTVSVLSDFGFSMLAESFPDYGGDDASYSDIISLNTNTEYSIGFLIELDVMSYSVDTPPEWFASWANYNAFLGNEDYGVLIADMDGSLDLDLAVTSVEIPLPSTLLLLSAGSFALLRSRKKRTYQH